MLHVHHHVTCTYFAGLQCNVNNLCYFFTNCLHHVVDKMQTRFNWKSEFYSETMDFKCKELHPVLTAN